MGKTLILHQQTRKKLFSRLSWHLLSVPIYFKIMGIGLVVALLFGTVTLFQTSHNIADILYQNLEQATLSTAASLSENLERPMTINDIFMVKEQIQKTSRTFDDTRYIIVRDSRKNIVAHTFKEAVPLDVQRIFPAAIPQEGVIQLFGNSEGRIFNATVPILNGIAGSLQFGTTDLNITRKLTRISESIITTLMVCMVFGAGLALILTYLLTQPIRHLVHATNRIRSGYFETRSKIFSSDEIGRLATVFNQMAEGLQNYRTEVQEKERTRLALLEKLVNVQEEERKHIARELHDELGQSLLAILLAIQSNCRFSGMDGTVCSDLEKRIREIIDEVRRLAWGMRPAILDDYGLDSALSRYIEAVSEQSNTHIDYQYTRLSGHERLPSSLETTLYRVVQEGLTNILRHAEATHVSVIVLQHPEEVTLLVEDNGREFDITRDRDDKISFGLTGMRERIGIMNGQFDVESEIGKGTTIRVQIPLEKKIECLSMS